MAKKILFTEQDDYVVDPGAASRIPDDALKNLLCRTEEAVINMNKLIVEMAAHVADQTAVLDKRIPEMVEAVNSVRDAIEKNTKDSFKKSDQLIEKLDETIAASKGVRDGLKSTKTSKRCTGACKRSCKTSRN